MLNLLRQLLFPVKTISINDAYKYRAVVIFGNCVFARNGTITVTIREGYVVINGHKYKTKDEAQSDSDVDRCDRISI